MGSTASGTDDHNLPRYLAKIIAIAEQAEIPFIERKFLPDEKWRRYSGSETSRYSGLLREHEPALDRLLFHRKLVVVGEPGSGKSTIAKEAARRLASAKPIQELPVAINLRSYRGDLDTLVPNSVPAKSLSGDDPRRRYILDGLDEVPREYVSRAITQILSLLSSDPTCSVMVTSRQAFHTQHSAAFGPDFTVFHVLDFDEDDLRAFARHRGIDPQRFLHEVEESDIEAEVRNPLNAWTVSSLMLAGDPLSKLRSENINTVIDALLRSRPAIGLIRLRRAVQLMAVGMEVYSRNELSLQEAKQILVAGLAVSELEAQGILEELFHSILLQTPQGVIFQLRTYGELLAALELQNQPFARIRTLFSLEDGTPNPSWLNAIALLAELNTEVRRYFIRNYPEWMLHSSLHVFSPEERTSTVDQVITKLNDNRQYLFSHPTIRAGNLARFLTPQSRQRLLRDLASPLSEVQANALLVLGLGKATEIIPHTLPIAIDISRADPVRLAAITALTSMESPGLLDTIIPALDRSDPHYATMLECVGLNVSEEDISRALPLILSTNTMLTGVYFRFRNMRSRTAVEQLLRYIECEPQVLGNIHAEAYLEPILKAIPEHCDDAMADSLARILLLIEVGNVYVTKAFQPLLLEPIERNGYTERVCSFLLLRFYVIGRRPIRMGQVLGRWMTMAHARWLIDAHALQLIQQLSPFIPLGEVREFLSPYSLGVMQAQEENSEQFRHQEQKRQERHDNRIANLREVIERGELLQVLQAYYDLKEEQWPDLTDPRRAWINDQVSDRLLALDLGTSISYGANTSWHEPPELQTLLRIVDRYELHLHNDEPLVDTLKAWPGHTITNHYKRYGFSDGAAQLFIGLVQGAHERNTIHENVMSFLDNTDFVWTTFTDDLMRFVNDPSSGHIGHRALSTLVKRGVSTEILKECLCSTDESIREIAFAELVNRQDRPTISRAMATLLQDEQNLKDADVGPPGDGPAAWIDRITAAWAWDDLVRLRRLTLHHQLVYLSDRVTNKLRKLDVARLANTVRVQMRDAPEGWRARQSSFALECDREAQLLAARSLPFERVLNLLKVSTSLITLKIYVEGSTDVPVYAQFLTEMGEPGLAEHIDLVNGWGNLSNRPVDRWLDGCREAVLIMDGDRGRVFDKPGAPYSSEARKAFAAFRQRTIRLFILDRYGIENYFTQYAVEGVTGRDLTGWWPLPSSEAILSYLTEPDGSRFYSKSMNEEVAKRMSVSDIASTDLGAILQKVCQVARQLRGD
jgi:hypothetical protein